MDEVKNKMRSIWFLIGLVMSAIGFITVLAGIFSVNASENQDVRLSNLHANIWWGVLILIIGLIYIVKNRNKYVDH
jgi:Na+/H+-translocating membrane pyrophosphatase